MYTTPLSVSAIKIYRIDLPFTRALDCDILQDDLNRLGVGEEMGDGLPSR